MSDVARQKPTKANIVKALTDNYVREIQAAEAYRALAAKETDPKRQAILTRLAETEDAHAASWQERLRQVGVTQVPSAKTSFWKKTQLKSSSLATNLERMEREENRNVAAYEAQKRFGDADLTKLLDDIEADERKHARSVRTLVSTDPANSMNLMLVRERWHKRTGTGWVGDAVYGVNDGLGAVFGIISGVAGFTEAGRYVLISGLAGMIASALSMGAGAYLATKSNREMVEAEVHQEQQEIEQDPAHEREELELLYQLKGFTEHEASVLADRITSDPDLYLRTMVQEELGVSESTFPNPWRSAVSGGLSTAVGAIVPVIPFFFMTGIPAIATAAGISIVAHFLVGAAKSLVTVRSWWRSGLEMTTVGVIEGVVTYSLGLLGASLIH
jgi:VIT1/CCC1 family predicted Fe2+/Mn2+ transporter/rubrerythrin